MNKFTLRYNSIPLGSLSNLRPKIRKIAIVSVRLKTDFWPSSRFNYSTFQGPTVKMQVQCYSTPGVVYKYVKLTRTEETRKLLWNAKLCINTCGLSRFFNARLPGGSYCMRCMRYVFADIVRAHHETLWRIVAEAQLAPSFCTEAPKHEKMRFFAEIAGFLRASCWTQAVYFCRCW